LEKERKSLQDILSQAAAYVEEQKKKCSQIHRRVLGAEKLPKGKTLATEQTLKLLHACPLLPSDKGIAGTTLGKDLYLYYPKFKSVKSLKFLCSIAKLPSLRTVFVLNFRKFHIPEKRIAAIGAIVSSLGHYFCSAVAPKKYKYK